MRAKITFIFLLSFTIITSKAQDNNYVKGLKEFDAKNFEKSVEYLRPYADSGNCVAQFAVGFCYSDETSFANDSIAEIYLLRAAEQKNTRSMGVLSTLYFKKSYSDKSYIVKALAWAEIAAEYDIVQKGLSTRYLIRQYMTNDEIKKAENIIQDKKKKFDKLKSCN